MLGAGLRLRPVAAAAVVGVMLAACGGAMSLTEYAEALEAHAEDASSRFDPINAALFGPDATLTEARLAVKEAAAISSEFHANLETLDPPEELADLHALVLELHRDVVAIQQEWAESADEAPTLVDLVFDSPEAQAVHSSLATALEACARLQDALDATAERVVFEDVPWVPESLQESIDVALGCPSDA